MPRYTFIAGCPACGKKEKYKWVHKNCSKYEEIDENGFIYCLGCNRNLGFLMDLEYNCGGHDYEAPRDATSIFLALAMLTDAQKEIPEWFAKQISAKVWERLHN